MDEGKETTRRSNIFLGERQVPLFSRFVARLIDVVIALAMYLLFKALWLPLGIFAACTYVGLQDGLGVGQSVGKRLLGLRVIDDQRGLPATMRHSFFRNLPFVLAIPLLGSPLSWLFLLFLIGPIILLETYLIVALDSGIRVGDVLANTLVVEHLEDSLVAFR